MCIDKMSVAKCLFLTLLTVTVKSEVCPQTYRVDRGHLNKRLVGHVLYDRKVDGLHACVYDCMFLGACKSFNYITGNKLCEINNISSTSVLASADKFVAEPGTLFADITEFPPTMVGGCANHKCGYYKRCYPAGHSYICADIDCGALPSVTDGSVALDGTTSTFGSTATMTCDSGYDASHGSISCKASGGWEVPTCTIKDCGALPSVTDGSVALDGTTSTFGSTATVTCDSGYDASHGSISCQATGRWEVPTCTIKDCGALPSVTDGSLALDGTTSTYGSTATVTCDSGYDASHGSISCKASGGREVPTCTIKDCGALPSVTDGSVALDGTTSTFGSTATVTCDSGYDASHGSISCQATGRWEVPTCTIKDCGALPSVTDGSLALDGTTSIYGSTATVTCDSGYDASHGSISCKASGGWEVPTCTIKDCGALPSVTDGSLALDGTTSIYGSTATVTCDSGYDASHGSISCKASGGWEVPTCTIKDCGALPSVTDGSVALDGTTSTFGSTATVTCDSGYDASHGSISCQATGRWEVPTCTIKDCGALPSVTDGSLALDGTTSTYGSTATVTCDSGYDASHGSISCQATGSWEVPTCTIKEVVFVGARVRYNGNTEWTGTVTAVHADGSVDVKWDYGSTYGPYTVGAGEEDVSLI